MIFPSHYQVTPLSVVLCSTEKPTTLRLSIGHVFDHRKSFWTIGAIIMQKLRLSSWNTLKCNRCQPISALDFAYASANHRPQFKSGKSVSQSAARIHMMSYHMSKPLRFLWHTFHFNLFPFTFFTVRQVFQIL